MACAAFRRTAARLATLNMSMNHEWCGKRKVQHVVCAAHTHTSRCMLTTKENPGRDLIWS